MYWIFRILWLGMSHQSGKNSQWHAAHVLPPTGYHGVLHHLVEDEDEELKGDVVDRLTYGTWHILVSKSSYKDKHNDKNV